jgi:hypothetical protein
MATERIRESLEKAEASLRRATAELIEMRFGSPQWNKALEQALRNLQTAVQDPAFETGKESLRMLVQSVRTEVVRIQALLDAAAAFYCGWTSATPAGPGAYAPDGELQREGGGGRLTLNA